MADEIKCLTCGDSGDVHTIDGQWRGECTACDAAEILRMRAVLANVVRAWESVPGGGMVHVNVIQRWLVKEMKPSIDKVREALKERK